MIRTFGDLASEATIAPLLWIFVTLAVYFAAQRLQLWLGGTAFANPVLVAILLIGGTLLATRTPYFAYFSGARFIHFLLGPATVALAVPLARNIRHVHASLRSISLALLAGSTVSAVSGFALVRALGGSRQVALSMAPKAATTPIAIAVAQQIGGTPALTAALAILGGIFAAVVGERVLAALRLADHRTQGFAAGLAGSGIAAARAAKLGGLAAAFAGLGIALNGVATAFIAPVVASWWR